VILLTLLSAFAADLNCNGIDTTDEPLIDLSDPLCAANPQWTSADDYFDYEALGCHYPVDGLDVDGDGRSFGIFEVIDEEEAARWITLSCDLCPLIAESADTDTDGDGIGDACDDCPTDWDAIVLYSDISLSGLDYDSDGTPDACDVCPVDHDDQANSDDDALGDACDICPEDDDPNQLDTDDDTFGDACDNCPDLYNVSQTDSDGDGLGDACDPCTTLGGNRTDTDGDGVGDLCDNCPYTINTNQDDADDDGLGNACDACIILADAPQDDTDGDSYGDACDVCPDDYDPDQIDTDEDGIGDACDPDSLFYGGGCRWGGLSALLVMPFGVWRRRRRAGRPRRSQSSRHPPTGPGCR
jgi:hypothetical protein